MDNIQVNLYHYLTNTSCAFCSPAEAVVPSPQVYASVLEMSQMWFRNARAIFRWIETLGLYCSEKHCTNNVIWKEWSMPKKRPTRILMAFLHMKKLYIILQALHLLKFDLSIENNHLHNIFNLKTIWAKGGGRNLEKRKCYSSNVSREISQPVKASIGHILSDLFSELNFWHFITQSLSLPLLDEWFQIWNHFEWCHTVLNWVWYLHLSWVAVLPFAPICGQFSCKLN